MVARLVLDAIWRTRWGYLGQVAFLVPCWLMYVATGGGFMDLSMPAFSLEFAALLGPLFATLTMGLRALRHLPVTNRDLWRATWVVATVVPSAVLLATKITSLFLVVAFGGDPKVSAESIVLQALYDFIWAGTLLPLLPVLVYDGHAVARRTLAGEGASMVGLLACLGVPILLSPALPTHVGEFTSATTGVLIAGLAVSLGTLAWTPDRGLLAGERVRAQRAADPGGAATVTRLADRLTGISRVVIPHLMAVPALAVVACLALASYDIIWGSGPWWFVPQEPSVFDPADTGDRGLTLFLLVPCGMVAMLGIWAPWIRLLKVLPVSVGRINALLLLTPFATCAILWLLWLLGVSAYAVAYGTPRTLGLELTFGMASIGALAHAILLRVQGSVAYPGIVAVCGCVIPQVVAVGLIESPDPLLVVSMAAIALCAAALINHHTLTRSTSSSNAYRQVSVKPGMQVRSTM